MSLDAHDADRSPDRGRVDRFRPAAGPPMLVVAVTVLLLALTAVALSMGWRETSPAMLAAVGLAAACLAAIAAGAFWFARRRPATLVVGPEGLHLPIAWRRPLAWGDVERITRTRRRRLLQRDQDWLRVHPAPGVLPDHRLPGPRRLELWHLRVSGAHIPLEGIDAGADDVIASIERFRAVEEG